MALRFSPPRQMMIQQNRERVVVPSVIGRKKLSDNLQRIGVRLFPGTPTNSRAPWDVVPSSFCTTAFCTRSRHALESGKRCRPAFTVRSKVVNNGDFRRERGNRTTPSAKID